jgi:hypothetical protein
LSFHVTPRCHKWSQVYWPKFFLHFSSPQYFSNTSKKRIRDHNVRRWSIIRRKNWADMPSQLPRKSVSSMKFIQDMSNVFAFKYYKIQFLHRREHTISQYRDQSLNVMMENNHCSSWES